MAKFALLLRTLVLAAAAALGWAVWTTVDDVVDNHRAALVASRAEAAALRQDIAARDATIAERDAAIAELEAALRLLKIDHRKARLTVLRQGAGADGGTETTVRFVELSPEGWPLGPGTEATLPGKVAYVESLVIKFSDEYVERGDTWRGTSLCLFRRLFSERQSPEEGVPLDAEGQVPIPYGDDANASLAGLWMRFWDYANDPAAAEALGVRAIHGEAPFIELRPGRSYVVELRSSGGLSVRVE